MALYPWIKSLHLVFVVSWFAGIFYLPRLFVYHAMTEDAPGHERFVVMERKLFGIMTLAAVLAIVFGITLIVMNAAYFGGTLMRAGWMHAKLALVLVLIAYHVYCARVMANFRGGREGRSHIWFRWFNEAPVFLLIAVVVLAVVRPF